MVKLAENIRQRIIFEEHHWWKRGLPIAKSK